MTPVERAMQSAMDDLLQRTEEDHRKALDDLKKSNGGELPPFLKHTLGLIKRAQVRDPLYQPIVSVQPMTQPVGGVAFYRPRYGSEITRVETPVGKEVLFKVSTLAALLWLLDQAADGSLNLTSGRTKVLQGFSGERHCVSFFRDEFRVLDGLGQVQEGTGLEVNGLKTNEGYVDFLLTLNWQSAFGWPTEMHVLGVASTDGVEVAEEKTV